MIQPVKASDKVSLHLVSDADGQVESHLTVHHSGEPGVVGLVVSDTDGRHNIAAIRLDATDRLALAAALLDGLDT